MTSQKAIDAWFEHLDAWCHLRKELRSFSVDAIAAVEILDREATAVAETRLNKALGSGYGIFAGEAVKWATLLFSGERAKWVKDEQWHPDQVGRLQEDGRYELRVPYADDRELLMDILRHGQDCVVVEPKELRQRVMAEVAVMVANY